MARRPEIPQAVTDELLERYDRYLVGQRSMARSSIRVYRDDLRGFLLYCSFNDLDVKDMNRRMLSGYVAHLATGKGKSAGYARSTIVRKLTALRAFYNFLVQEQWFSASPMPPARAFPIKTEQRLPKFLGRGEAARLMESADGDSPQELRDRALLELLYGAGIRLSEAHHLNLSNLDAPNQRALVTGKGNRQRWVIFGRPAATAIGHYLQDGRPMLAASARDDDPVFVNRSGGRLSRRSIQAAVSKHADLAGISREVHPHTLRHSFATHMLEGRTDLRVIQELMGHASVATTQIYTHVTNVEAKAAYLSYHPMARQ